MPVLNPAAGGENSYLIHHQKSRRSAPRSEVYVPVRDGGERPQTLHLWRRCWSLEPARNF